MEHSREMALRREGAGVSKCQAVCLLRVLEHVCRLLEQLCAEHKAGLGTRGSLASVGATAHAAPNGAPGLRAVLRAVPSGLVAPMVPALGVGVGYVCRALSVLACSCFPLPVPLATLQQEKPG